MSYCLPYQELMLLTFTFGEFNLDGGFKFVD